MTAKASARRSPEQRRASDALRAVHQLPEDRELRRRYRAYTDRLGPAILINGLGQALASERAAAGTPASPREHAHACLFRNLQAWLCGDSGVYRGGDVLAQIVEGSEARYLQAQTEALAWLTWHKKFCRAELPVPAISDPQIAPEGAS
ncbi:MAG TPA: type III-B CRISPR module-associated protein Cmr5 [Kofleriaceae bacterium]|nr:type III-B CRISPR module-associated protein Cmr5 [Kofleriaceae bacterium]